MTLLATHDVHVRHGQRAVLSGVSFGVAAGELVGLVGPNGAGKTTLIRVLAGLAAPARGEATLEGIRLDKLRLEERARRIAFLPQAGDCAWSLSVADVVALGRLPHRSAHARNGAADLAALRTVMTECGLTDLATRRIDRLSGGERARVLLARALAVEPEILLADEPVAGLDPRHQLQVMDVLRQRTEAGQATVAVLHDLGLAARYCHRLALLRDGRILADGPPQAVLTRDNLAAAFGLPMELTDVAGWPVVVPSARERVSP
ncbi:MAG: ABC transporter ATP-binding protein [Rhodospirillales bacterium]|nr:ABC transporter ATP-binding protein [Rhodospirillales bacterium]